MEKDKFPQLVNKEFPWWGNEEFPQLDYQKFPQILKISLDRRSQLFAGLECPWWDYDPGPPGRGGVTQGKTRWKIKEGFKSPLVQSPPEGH